MESFALFEKKYKSQMSKKDKYKASKDYLMLKTQQSKLGKMPDKYKERYMKRDDSGQHTIDLATITQTPPQREAQAIELDFCGVKK